MHDTFFFTDIHGNLNLYNSIMKYINEQDSEACIVYGGDACDRGDNGLAIITSLLNDPRVVYIKGNHEDMFIDSAETMYPIITKRTDIDWSSREQTKAAISKMALIDGNIYNHVANGGLETLISWICDYNYDMEIINNLKNLPLIFSYENLDFCHAGGTPQTFERISKAYYNKIHVNQRDKTHVLWDRSSFKIGWTPNRMCVHGHTPTPFLPKHYLDEDIKNGMIHPITYYGNFYKNLSGGKIDMDTGTANTGIIYLLNCTTMEMHKFKDNKEE